PRRGPGGQRHGRRERGRDLRPRLHRELRARLSAAIAMSQGALPNEDAYEELGPIGHLGAAAIDLLIGGRELYSVFVRTLYYTFRGRRERGALAQQMFEIGNKSVFFLSITMGFIGMILAYQAGLQA